MLLLLFQKVHNLQCHRLNSFISSRYCVARFLLCVCVFFSLFSFLFDGIRHKAAAEGFNLLSQSLLLIGVLLSNYNVDGFNIERWSYCLRALYVGFNP